MGEWNEKRNETKLNRRKYSYIQDTTVHKIDAS